MKFWTFCMAMLIPVLSLWGQGVYIGSTNLEPEDYTILEVESTAQGVLIPRLSLSELMAISNPAEGLMAYNTTDDVLSYYNGTRWMGVDGSQSYFLPGDTYQGGIIFEVDGTGLHGKIVSLADLGQVAWGCRGTTITGADSDTDGATNTSDIVAECADPSFAAKLCDDYSVLDGGVTYDDWYLPALDELTAIYNAQSEIGALTYDFYYSSTERNSEEAMGVKFHDSGIDGYRLKDKSWYVRAIRAF